MKLSEMTTFEVQKLSRNTVVLFPIAALEQHSRHLPVFTDSILCGAVAEGVTPRATPAGTESSATGSKNAWSLEKPSL